MKYSDIIHINENFIPVFDLENEESDQLWPLFIPNDKFRDILSSVIDSLIHPSKKNPVWLQGTYGTGKSHATSVIKHLLCDEEIPDFNLDDNQLTAKLNKFRKDHIFDPKTKKLIYVLKKIIEDKNSILVSLEEELYSSSKQALQFLSNQLNNLQKENADIYRYIQGNNFESFKKDNNNEKSQINALLIKIIECQENINDLIKNLFDINDTSSAMKRNFEKKSDK